MSSHKQPSRGRRFQAPETNSSSYSFQMVNDNGQEPHGRAIGFKSELRQQYITDAVNHSNIKHFKAKIAAKEQDTKDHSLYGKWEDMGPPTLCIYREGRSYPKAFPGLYFGPQEPSTKSVTCLPLGPNLTKILDSAFSGLKFGPPKEFTRSPFGSPLPYTANTMRFARNPEVKKSFVPHKSVFNKRLGSRSIYYYNEEYNNATNSASTDKSGAFYPDFNRTTAPSTASPGAILINIDASQAMRSEAFTAEVCVG
ncbi:hypothetical protein RUND412_002345 [Rhizina undulata]